MQMQTRSVNAHYPPRRRLAAYVVRVAAPRAALGSGYRGERGPSLFLPPALSRPHIALQRRAPRRALACCASPIGAARRGAIASALLPQPMLPPSVAK